MRLVESVAALLRPVDEIQLVPGPSVRGSERFPDTCDWQVLKWIGMVTLGTAVGALGGNQVDSPSVLGLGTVVGMTIGFFGGIVLVNRIIGVQ